MFQGLLAKPTPADAVRTALLRLNCAPDELHDGALLLEDLGLDSFRMIEFVSLIEDQLRIRFRRGVDRELAQARTLGDFVARLEQAQQAKRP